MEMMELGFDVRAVPTPCYVVDARLIERNCRALRDVADRSGCKVLLAQKAFSMFSLYPVIGRYLDGTCASGLHEAMLSHEYMGKENHAFAAAYSDAEMDALVGICDHLVFNSFAQWRKFRARALAAGVQCGIRINPERSTQDGHALYDPCAPGSRLGVTLENFEPDQLDGISGLHFHTLCEQNADALIETLAAVEARFGRWFDRMDWINFGGGHHITRKDYDVDALVDCVKDFRERTGLQVYLEPGEAVALDAGYLVSRVLDVVENGRQVAIMDTSAACHMPDVLEMPYRPRVVGEGGACRYTLAGATCLAGDVIGEYRFPQPLKVGDFVVFEDMAIYSMVKNNTFNGTNLPGIAVVERDGTVRAVKAFGYEDFRGRLS